MIAGNLKVDPRQVHHVLDKLNKENAVAPQRASVDHKNRILTGSWKVDRAAGVLSSGFRLRNTTNFVMKKVAQEKMDPGLQELVMVGKRRNK